jgi:HEAT repeat protein
MATDDKNETRVEIWIRSLKNRPVIAAVVVAAIVITGGADVVNKIFSIWPNLGPAAAVNVAAVSNVVESQLEAHDYSAAWDTVTEANRSHPTGDALLPLQTKIASVWVRNLSVTPPQKFADVVDKLLPPLYRTAQRSKGVDAADALAHIGWANFLKSREGGFKLDIDVKYREALQLDPDNPFAHAMWGHWLIVNGNHIAEAQQHFAVALKSGRERKFVREFQLAALQSVGADENAVELIRVCNQMRKENDLLPEESRNRLFGEIYFMHRDSVLANLDQILPADEHLATFQWLTQGIDKTKSIEHTFFLARLLEASGNCDVAQGLYVSALAARRWSGKAREGLERCRLRSPQPKSEVELLTEWLHDKRAVVRRGAVEGLSAVLAGGAGIDVKVIVPALRDPDAEVRAAAAEALARSGRQALAPMIELLGSAEPADQVRAAAVLAKMGAESKAAVPALVRVLGASDDAQQAALKALVNIGPDASAAVAPISKMLGAKPSLDKRKALIYALGEIGPASKPAVPLITEALRDQSDSAGFLNENAADALGKIGPGAASAVPALIVALGSDNVRLATRATVALGNIGAEAKAAIPALVEAMGRQEQDHKKNQAEAVGQIAQALAIRKDRRALKVLRAALRAEENAGLGLATVGPLREAIDHLDSGGE